MYLKSLHVVGFKSFADRTTLEFHRGITAIVGPNGCGKSNVLDAIRWVLGEQSAKALRGGEMKDVIFSGTETRPPLGMAEVSLTFGDCEEQLGVEYNEVTITRRVFRDGASEYELNKTPCRLRDIHSLFMDTGIGRSAYSIMEQGKIDQILSSRPEDRRAIFEEAAGITKYKSQKKEALRKLEHTEANLLRLADIIREVKRQIGSLQRQAGKARRYQASFDELAALERRFGRRQFDAYSGEIEALETKLEETRRRQEALDRDLAAQDEKVATAREELAALDAELMRRHDEQNELRHALERAGERAATNRARVTEFSGLRDHARQEIAGLEEKSRVAADHLAQLDGQIEALAHQRVETQKRFDAGEAAKQALADEISSLEAERAGLEESRAAQEKSLQRAEQERESLELQQRNFQVRFESLQAELAALQKQREETAEAVKRQSARRAEAETRLQESRDALQARQFTRSEAEEALRAAETAGDEIRRAHQQLKARHEALAQLEQEHASAPQAAQRLLRDAESAQLQGTLSEHLTVQAGYEAPLALLLGDAVNALVLRDDAAARAWRDKLDGREQCAFAPRHAARPAPLPSTALTHATFFVTAQPIVAHLVAALLEDAHVVEDLDAGWQLKAAQPQCTVATRAGELITRSGLVLVGQDTGASLAVLTRQAELRRLETGLGDSDRRLAAAQASIDEARAQLGEKNAAIEQARAAAQEAEIALAAQRQEERAAEAAVAQLERQAGDITREIDRLQAQEKADHDRAEKLRASIEAARAALEEAESEMAQAQRQLDEAAEKEAQQSAAQTELRIELATQTQQCETSRQQREPVAARREELRELIAQRTREAADHDQRVAQAQHEIVEAEREQGEQREALARAGVELEQAQARRNESHTAIAGQEHALRTLRREHGEIQTARAETEVKLAGQKLFLGNLRERFRRDYHQDLEELPALGAEEASTDWEALEIEVASKRAALEAIGPVNLEAITEYDELEQRHQFLTGQETDLLNAKDQILKAIQEINRTTQKLFAETFAQIKTNFQEMFGELFGGGRANLALLDENDPLECGIDIQAKPPGKQNQSVALLSGGERTMTAVALLFAIYMVKPSPFCVLDELDAPLDESNINRFVKILYRFVRQSQFVVITHNKRTISAADVLYGVTMEERGVSRFVSMRLQKDSNRAAASSREESVPSIAESVAG